MHKKLSLPFSIFLVTFQPIFELSIAIDMNAIANLNVKLGTQFTAEDINAIANSNAKLAINNGFLINSKWWWIYYSIISTLICSTHTISLLFSISWAINHSILGKSSLYLDKEDLPNFEKKPRIETNHFYLI